MAGGFACRPPCTLGLPVPSDSQPDILRHSIAPVRKYRNINLFPIDYAFRPRLRDRLTLGGRACPRKPWIIGGQDSHLPVATHACIFTCVRSTMSRDTASARTQRSPTTSYSVYHTVILHT